MYFNSYQLECYFIQFLTAFYPACLRTFFLHLTLYCLRCVLRVEHCNKRLNVMSCYVIVRLTCTESAV